MEYVEIEEMNFKGNVITCNPSTNESKLIIGSNYELPEKPKNVNFQHECIDEYSKVELDNGIFLIADKLNDEERLSLYIHDIIEDEKYEIFRNCSNINKQYFSCGRTPFAIVAVHDVNGDQCSEFVIDADKEFGTMRLLIGIKDGKFNLLKQGEL
jgi:hypothetical protein